jgi:YidC/Oxa1 family membrane protein insertase
MLISANIFQPLIDVFETILKAIHSVIGGSWGWSIILLTVIVRACLIPLTVKQFHSMQRLQQLQPELKALQAKYKDDKERQQQEMMKFYKENKVNPLGSCLPLVAQLPVFISLFYMLRTSLRIDICPGVQRAHNHGVLSVAHTVPCGPGHGAGFLFIPDLTNKASGAVLIVLILLYIGTQLASSLMMSSPTMDKTQRQIMLFMPLLFVLFVINFPAGVILYWITTNTWTIAQQFVIKRRIGPVQAPVAAAAGTAGGTSVVARSRPSSKPDDGRGGDAAGAAAKGAPAAKAAPDAKTTAPASGNGSGSGGGLGALIRGRGKANKEAAAVATTQRSGPPPRPPRKKKKRSGRRR